MSFFKNLFSKKESKPTPPKVLLEAESPLCPLMAIVEQDNHTAYLYLTGGENSPFGMRSCWIRNLQPAPDQPDSKLMKKGFPPMMPKKNCAFPEGQAPLVTEDLSFVWFEEGDAVALFEKDQILAIIPGWSGVQGFDGYARDCVGQGDFAWETTPENALHQRVTTAARQWQSWEAEADPFQVKKPILLALYEEHLGKMEQYFAIDLEAGLPKGMYRRKGEQYTVWATVGMGLSPQPKVEQYTEEPANLHRIELGMMLDAGLDDEPLTQIGYWINGISDLPWDSIHWLGDGHTVNFQGFPGDRFPYVLLTHQLSVFPQLPLPEYRGSKVNFLWLIPITESERQFAMEQGSDILIQALEAIGESVFSLERKTVH